MTRIPPTRSAHEAAAAIGHPVPHSVEEAAVELVPMTLTSLNLTLETWLPACRRAGVMLVQGGWEEWAQFDLLGWLHESLGATQRRRWDVQRNARVYTDPDLRADLLFNGDTYDPVRPMLVVEILAESPLVERPDFLNRMHREADQLRAMHLKPAYAAARRMLLALTVDPATPTVLQKHGFGAVVSTPKGCTAMWREVGG